MIITTRLAGGLGWTLPTGWLTSECSLWPGSGSHLPAKRTPHSPEGLAMVVTSLFELGEQIKHQIG